MDPNELMREIMTHLQVMNDKSTTRPTRATHGEWLADRIGQLDTHIITGGELPSRWRPPRTLDERDAALERAHEGVRDASSALADVQRELDSATTLVDELLELLDERPTWKGKV